MWATVLLFRLFDPGERKQDLEISKIKLVKMYTILIPILGVVKGRCSKAI